MTSITLFSFENAAVRTVSIDGAPHFVGKDVCEILKYSNPTTAMNSHCKGVALRYPLQTAGGLQDVRVLSEPDVLRLIVRSTLPEAERFEKWLFEEVLPAIRKTGSYTAPGAPANEGTASALLVAEFTARMLHLQGSSLLGYVGRVNELLAPGLVPALPNYAVNEPAGQSTTGSSEPTFSLTTLLKKNGVAVTAAVMNKRLAAAGIIERMSRPSSKGGAKAFWAITEKGLAYGRNLCSPKNEREVAPAFYASRFDALLAQVG